MERDERERVGERIRRARRETGLTQTELAELLGITTRSVQNYESGAIVPYRHLARIEQLTRKRYGWLVGDAAADGRLDDAIADLRRTMERQQALLQDHLRILAENTERLREQRDLRERRRRSAPDAG